MLGVKIDASFIDLLLDFITYRMMDALHFSIWVILPTFFAIVWYCLQLSVSLVERMFGVDREQDIEDIVIPPSMVPVRRLCIVRYRG